MNQELFFISLLGYLSCSDIYSIWLAQLDMITISTDEEFLGGYIMIYTVSQQLTNDILGSVSI